MNRRKFLSVLSGAVAAVAGGLGLRQKPVATPKNLLAEAYKKLKPLKSPGPIVVTAIDPSAFDQAATLQDLMNRQFGDSSNLRGFDPDRRLYLAFDKDGLCWVPRGDA